MTMQVTFAISGPGSAVSDETQARAALDAGVLPTGEHYLFGSIRCTHEGEPALMLSDDLNMMVPRCLRAIATLRATGRAELSMASHYCDISLIANAGTVHVLQTDPDLAGEEVACYPKDDFIRELAACCARFARYVGALAARDPQWSGLHGELMDRVG